MRARKGNTTLSTKINNTNSLALAIFQTAEAPCIHTRPREGKTDGRHVNVAKGSPKPIPVDSLSTTNLGFVYVGPYVTSMTTEFDTIDSCI